jgi:hypothetical protein
MLGIIRYNSRLHVCSSLAGGETAKTAEPGTHQGRGGETRRTAADFQVVQPYEHLASYNPECCILATVALSL